MTRPALDSSGPVLPRAVVERPMDVVLRPRPGLEKARSVFADFLVDLGCNARIVAADEFEPQPGRIAWFMGSPVWYRRVLRRIGSAAPDRRPLVIAWLNEPLPLPRGAPFRWFPPFNLAELTKVVLHDDRVTDPYSNAREVKRLVGHGLVDVVAVSMLSGRVYLEERGIAAEFAPMGYTPDYGRDLGLERDIDVLFLGVPVPRRKRLIRHLRRRGVPVRSVGSWTDARYWGERRTELLNRTKILLNFPRRPGLLSGMRMVLGMANGALVIGEPVYMPSPFEPGRHYVEAPIDEIPAAVERWLEDEPGRLAMTGEARRFVTEEHRHERSVATVLDAAAAALERSR